MSIYALLQRVSNRGWREYSAYRFDLHAFNLGASPSTTYETLSPTRNDVSDESGISTETLRL